MKCRHHIACDLGAESGRVMLAALDGDRLTLEELHRFPNGAIRLAGTLRWDVARLWEEVKIGMANAASRAHPIASISVDSWALDYVLMRRSEPLLRLPYHYRDPRSSRSYRAARDRAGEERIFRCTGIQFMPMNTLYQLLCDLQDDADLLRTADGFLLIADWFHFLLSGKRAQEESNASTTQLYDPRAHAWSAEVIDFFDLPKQMFPTVVPPCTMLGTLLPDVARETGLAEIEVVAGCTHDTGAAVAAVPAEGDGWAYLSSGTWSLIGVELATPLITEAVRAANFTNEIGCGGTIRFLKNNAGLWILQECRRDWSRSRASISYDELTDAASAADPLRSMIDPNDPRFIEMGDMPRKISAFCRETRQPEPLTPAATVRCVLESLALLYRLALDTIEELTGQRILFLHIVGGGSRNSLLNQFAANATGRTVIAGPVEATAIGNALLQAVALGNLDSLAAVRQVVRCSFPSETFTASEPVIWSRAYERFRNLI